MSDYFECTEEELLLSDLLCFGLVREVKLALEWSCTFEPEPELEPEFELDHAGRVVTIKARRLRHRDYIWNYTRAAFPLIIEMVSKLSPQSARFTVSLTKEEAKHFKNGLKKLLKKLIEIILSLFVSQVSRGAIRGHAQFQLFPILIGKLKPTADGESDDSVSLKVKKEIDNKLTRIGRTHGQANKNIIGRQRERVEYSYYRDRAA
ncbi:MAG: hypothetical protein JKY66_08225 [Spongiibacteraceae bacterium]|nr:hypothetical protein [Spongiibacteraceae bacterium]